MRFVFTLCVDDVQFQRSNTKPTKDTDERTGARSRSDSDDDAGAGNDADDDDDD